MSDTAPEKAQEEKIIRSFFSSQSPLKLKQMPSKIAKAKVVAERVAREFEQEKVYSEQEINTVLKGIYPDYATLRRTLIDFGFLTRSSDGREYRAAEQAAEKRKDG